MKEAKSGPPCRSSDAYQNLRRSTHALRLASVLLGLLLVATPLCLYSRGCTLPVSGIVWQVDNATLDPRGSFDQLGARRLFIQWTAVDDAAFIPNIPGWDLGTYPVLPDWQRIATEPWGDEVILGLAGYFDEASARANVGELTRQSLLLSQARTPLNVVGYYFPVEVDPTWREAPNLVPYLNRLPRPLWISVYDSANVGAQTLANWLASWLPPDVGVFFQDGVGIYVREPSVARGYADALAKRLGRNRVRIIAEAFRPAVGGGFRAATANELAPQIAAYSGYQVYPFDGPHYISNALIEELNRKWCWTAIRGR